MSRRAITAGVVGAILLGVAGCSMSEIFGVKEEGAPGEPAPDGVFSHRHHPTLVSNCRICHKASGGGQYYPTPGNLCEACHEGLGWVPDPKVLSRTRVVGPFHHDRHFIGSRRAGKPADECIDCHVGIRSSDHRDKLTSKNVPSMEGCYTCHTRITTLGGKAGTECSLCHVPGDFSEPMYHALREALLAGRSQDEIDRGLIPQSHLEFIERR